MRYWKVSVFCEVADEPVMGAVMKRLQKVTHKSKLHLQKDTVLAENLQVPTDLEDMQIMMRTESMRADCFADTTYRDGYRNALAWADALIEQRRVWRNND